MKATKLSKSMAGIASRSPSERLRGESRYVVLADLRMGDGGGKDELAGQKKALFDILGKWYLPRGYTLILNGDIEDLRRFWLKDIFAAWPEVYALFDAFNEKSKLRKIVGDRDLALLRLRSYPYALSHALRLDGESNSVLVFHGHQASPPYYGSDYLADYMVRWQGYPGRASSKECQEDRGERFKAERRMYRAASSLRIIAIQGHTRRPLFESKTNRDSVRSEIERLLREGDPKGSDSKVDKLIEIYRREEKRHARRSLPSGPAYDPRSLVVPCLFSPGRLIGGNAQGGRALRMLELEDGFINLVRWVEATPGEGPARGSEAPPRSGGGFPYLRLEARSASVQGLFERIELLARGDEERKEDMP
jgi:hypothetical protein